MEQIAPMLRDRREFILGAAAAGGLFHGQACAAATQVVAPEQFGAVGDGRSDDTAALQRCFDRAPAGAVVRLRRGAVYLVDTNFNPTWARFGGVKLRSGQILELNGAELRAIPTGEGQGAVIQAYRQSNWRIKGPGKVTGERSRHRGTAGEWGMGIAAFASNGWKVESGVEVANCWGDGIYVGAGGPGTFCENFAIDGVRVLNCRRNGISIVAGRNGRIRAADISDINGIAPKGGIDLEPDNRAHANRNIEISGVRIHGDLEVGIYTTVANENVLISDVDIEANNSGIIVGDSASGIRILNSRIASRIGGAEGAAIRAVGNPAKIRGIEIRSNQLRGGGYFVVDFFGEGYRNLVVASNELSATNRGVQGIARVHYGSFVDNIAVIDRNAGKEGDYFVHLIGTSHGRNRYRNLSRHKMYGAVRGGTHLGGDSYDASLQRWVFDPA
jgi:hypothetical protein